MLLCAAIACAIGVPTWTEKAFLFLITEAFFGTASIVVLCMIPVNIRKDHEIAVLKDTAKEIVTMDSSIVVGDIWRIGNPVGRIFMVESVGFSGVAHGRMTGEDRRVSIVASDLARDATLLVRNGEPVATDDLRKALQRAEAAEEIVSLVRAMRMSVCGAVGSRVTVSVNEDPYNELRKRL
jgi:hypothetical protein